MPPLSNLFRAGDGAGRLPRGPLRCRPVVRGEVEAALRLMLATANGKASDEQILDFLSFAIERNIDVNTIWITECDGTIYWMLLPVASPGKTMLLFTPGRIPRGSPFEAISELADATTRYFAGRGVILAQMLIDPNDGAVIDAYLRCGFSRLAELVYLHRHTPHPLPAPPVPDGLSLAQYSQQTHALFAHAIKRSYEASLDCPALNGMRDIEDVIVGHKASGEFDPNLWFVLTENDSPIAALLLGRSHGDSLELVYLGLAAEARGRGIGDWLMQLALSRAASDRRGRLSLAVDSNNAPALALYYRHGMKRIGTRIALLKDLRGLAGATVPQIHVQTVQPAE